MDEVRPRTFDAICAGATFDLTRGGAVNVGLALARSGHRVAVATSGTVARSLQVELVARRVELSVAQPEAGLLLGETAFSVPEEWSSRLLLLSGVAPSVPYAAAMCRAARAARRKQAIVVLDLNAHWNRWRGHDPRSMRALLREADVVRCGPEDLAMLGSDATAMTTLLRRDAVSVVTNALGITTAFGAFGHVAVSPARQRHLRVVGAGDALTGAICAALVSRADRGEEFWHRALGAGHAAAAAVVAPIP